jgi:hypothetical protein
MGTGALGLTLAAAGGARAQSASVVVINEDGSVSTNATLAANPNAAQWVSPSAFVASSLETGRIGYIVAWGGNEFGYAYTYALSGAPAGVTIDPDTGILSIASPLAVRAYGFSVIVTNREVVTNVATFPISLTILQGVTANQTGTQILHKTHDPHSGAYGAPTGTDWTTVLLNMQKAILADQVAAGDEKLRATIMFRRGVTYNYTDNTWANGIQYLTVRDNPAYPTGMLPVLRCTRSTYNLDVQVQPLNAGAGGAMLHQGGIKALCALLKPVNVGDSVVTLKSAGDAYKIKPGRWHAVIGQQIQLGGYPPNCAWNDYVEVVSVVGTTVTLDRRLKYRYSDTWWEGPGDQDFGRAWLVPWDLGGTGGAVPSNPRATLRGLWLNIAFATNPNTKSGTQSVVQVQNYIDGSFENCSIPLLTCSMGKHYLVKNCTLTVQSEPDKLSETIVFDGCKTARIGGGTGFLYWLSRNTIHAPLQISPRQFRCLNSTIDATGDSNFYVPFSIAYNGPLMYYHFSGSTFKRGVGQNYWTWPGDSDPANPNTPRIQIGVNATWNGNRLIIPRTFAHFQDWLVGIYEGAIITTTKPPITANWGYISNLTSPGDGSAIWADIVWVNGAKPTSGFIYRGCKVRRLLFASNNVFAPGTRWSDPGFLKQTGPGVSYGFPAGYTD